MSPERKETVNLPTAEDIRQWRKERDRLMAEARAIRQRCAALDQMITGGEKLLDVPGLATPSTDAEPQANLKTPMARRESARRYMRRGKSKTWTATIFRIVREADRGLTYNELKAEMLKTHLGDRLRETDKALYGGVGKLAERGNVIRYHGRVFSPKAYHRFKEDVAAGCIADIPAPTSRGNGSPNEIAVERLLSALPNGATTGEIIDSLLNNPPPDLAVTKNKNSIYNLLARQRDKGKLIKRGNRYYLPMSKDEAPGSTEPSASNHHDDGNGTPSSSGNVGSRISLVAHPGAIPAHPGE